MLHDLGVRLLRAFAFSAVRNLEEALWCHTEVVRQRRYYLVRWVVSDPGAELRQVRNRNSKILQQQSFRDAEVREPCLRCCEKIVEPVPKHTPAGRYSDDAVCGITCHEHHRSSRTVPGRKQGPPHRLSCGARTGIDRTNRRSTPQDRDWRNLVRTEWHCRIPASEVGRRRQREFGSLQRRAVRCRVAPALRLLDCPARRALLFVRAAFSVLSNQG